ncbi:unnamed protein product [Acanthoscelides obtectus]|uniref:ZAD domain-containing protein n=1 Tax=Acanthoscelides obtectus TaxID=200917 RepID=A0A9P0PCC1_ACAOB|nr:unnamed protein product [Acanthoscelides obtectus]CAK1670240.1 hypothetical protein AOBTE_LOCUS27504 [Acanthoscelides obtectus]
MSSLTEQFKKICRTCLTESTASSKSIFALDTLAGESLKLGEMIMAFASVQISSDDGLPAQVCFDCAVAINKSFFFKQLCEQSEITLRGLLEESSLTERPLLVSDPLISVPEDKSTPQIVVLQNIELGKVVDLNYKQEDTELDNYEGNIIVLGPRSPYVLHTLPGNNHLHFYFKVSFLGKCHKISNYYGF